MSVLKCTGWFFVVTYVKGKILALIWVLIALLSIIPLTLSVS